MERRTYWLRALFAVTLFLMPSAARASEAQVSLLSRGFGHPDDMAWGPHGSIYFSDFGNGAVDRLDPSGRLSVVAGGLGTPEGIAVRPDGTLIVVDQRPGQLLRLDPGTGATTVLVTIANPLGLLGIDSIRRDRRDGSLVVPDSPNGRLLRIGRSGTVRVIARGLGRPVDALPLPDGTLMVVDEHLNGAFHIDMAGRARRLGGFLSVPDDIVADGHGGYYITCLGDSTLRHLTASGRTTLVATGLPNPQGLLRRADGALIVSEEDANRIVLVRP